MYNVLVVSVIITLIFLKVNNVFKFSQINLIVFFTLKILVYKLYQIKKTDNRSYLSLERVMGDGAEAPPVADAARRRREKQQADKAAPKLPLYASIVFLG